MPPDGFSELDWLVFCDLDNTLIGTDKYFDPDITKLVREAAGRGIGFTLATGRVYAAVERYARLLQLTLPLITNSGAFVSDPSGRHIYRQQRLSTDLALEVLFRTQNVPALRYAHVKGQVYAEKRDPESDRYAEILGVPFDYVCDLGVWIREAGREPVVIVIRFGRDPAGIAAARDFGQTAVEEYQGRLTVLRTLPHLVEFLHPQASKGKALRFVAGMLEVPLARTLALGDSEGDMDMLDQAGEGILVQNAPPGLWPRADRVTRGESGDGVKEVLGELLARTS